MPVPFIALYRPLYRLYRSLYPGAPFIPALFPNAKALVEKFKAQKR